MIGEGISLVELALLFKAIKNRSLVLEVKILDGTWERVDKKALLKLIDVVTAGKITKTEDVRLRLFAE